MAHLTEQILSSQRQLFALFFPNPSAPQTPSSGAPGAIALAPFQAMLDAWGQHAGGADMGSAFAKNVEMLREQWTTMWPQAASLWSPWTVAAGQARVRFSDWRSELRTRRHRGAANRPPGADRQQADSGRGSAQKAFNSSLDVQQAVASHRAHDCKGLATRLYTLRRGIPGRRQSTSPRRCARSIS